VEERDLGALVVEVGEIQDRARLLLAQSCDDVLREALQVGQRAILDLEVTDEHHRFRHPSTSSCG
jgi:hypothetical protein